MLIKICGITSFEEIDTINQYPVDFVGFVVGSPKSRRNLELHKMNELIGHLREEIKSVAVTVNPMILESLNESEVEIVQLHGNARAERHVLEKKVAMAMTYEEYQTIHATGMEYVVVDSRTKDHYGGTGKTWKWRELSWKKTPVLVAGGITPENMVEALEKTKADGVDLSSGLEKDGKKDQKLIARLFERYKYVERAFERYRYVETITNDRT